MMQPVNMQGSPFPSAFQQQSMTGSGVSNETLQNALGSASFNRSSQGTSWSPPGSMMASVGGGQNQLMAGINGTGANLNVTA